jgi:hypothetical protein
LFRNGNSPSPLIGVGFLGPFMNWRTAAVILVAAAHFINLLPTLLNFNRFAFGDNGWPLTVDSLIHDQNLTPAIDFAYFYGLLTLLVDRLSFAVFGRSPETVAGIYAVCAFAVALGAARIMNALQFRLMPALFVIVCSPIIAIPREFPSPAHALEAAFLMSALAEHAKGRLDRSLIFTVFAVLAKPSLGYVYGLILVVLVVAGWPGGASRWRRLIPAAGVAAGMMLVLGGLYGWQPLVHTLAPIDGLTAYSGADAGFLFGAGRLFWLPVNAPLHYQLGIPLIWLSSTLVLFLAVVRLPPRQCGANFVIVCAVLHAVFVFALFGNQWSWIYYSYVLFVGTAAALNEFPRSDKLAIALVIAAIVGQLNWVWIGDAAKWFETQRHEETAGLYASNEEAREWQQVRRKKNILVLTRMGCPQLLAPEVRGPQWWCLIEGIQKDGEKARAVRLISEADWIASPVWHDNDLIGWNSLAAALAPFEPDPESEQFRFIRVYRRKR